MEYIRGRTQNSPAAIRKIRMKMLPARERVNREHRGFPSFILAARLMCGVRIVAVAYPVITAGKFAHRDSFVNLLGDQYEEQIGLVSLENQVSPDTPPTFLWHMWDDRFVPVENSLLLAGALRRNGVPLEMHILPRGDHGLALASAETNSETESVKDWPIWAERWIRTLS